MYINPTIFRGYDLRGVVNRDLNPDIVEHLGRAYAAFLLKRGIGRAIVGHDCRATSPEYSQRLIQGLLSSGVNVIDIGLTLAGIFYWAQYHFNYLGGVMVTASHNPADYNGFKFATGLSSTMMSEEIQELRSICDGDNLIKGELKGMADKRDIKGSYFDDLLKRFNFIRKMKVAVDPSCSTPGFFVPELLRRAGFEVVENNCQLNACFPMGTPDPTEKAVAQRLAAKVTETAADIGFSYDADGDRIGVAAGDGQIMWNDILVALFAADVLDQNPGAKIVFNTLCSKVVEDVILARGGQPIMCRVGHSYIKAMAQKEGAKFAGELSGHFFFLDKFYPHDDGCYATLRLLDYLDRTNQTLSQAVASLPHYISSPEIKIGCPDELKIAFIEKVSRVLRNDFQEAKVIDDERAGDGVRLDMPDAMFVLRYSQNGPYLTVKFEAKSQERYEELKSYIKNLLNVYPEVDWTFGVNVESLS